MGGILKKKKESKWKKGYTLKARPHTQNCKYFGRWLLYLYLLTWQVIEFVRLVTTNCSSRDDHETSIEASKKHPDWLTMSCHVGGVNYVRVASAWNLDEMWMNFGWFHPSLFCFVFGHMLRFCFFFFLLCSIVQSSKVPWYQCWYPCKPHIYLPTRPTLRFFFFFWPSSQSILWVTKVGSVTKS